MSCKTRIVRIIFCKTTFHRVTQPAHGKDGLKNYHKYNHFKTVFGVLVSLESYDPSNIY